MATIAKERAAVTSPPRRSWEGISWSAWIWIAPAVILVLIFFIAPLIYTIYLSFQKTDSLGNVVGSVGFKNYAFVFSDPNMLGILKNNLIWLVLATILTVGLGLIVAVLVDRVRIESVVKSMLFVPMAISFVGASVIWRFVYIYEPKGQTQIGLLNAFLGLFGASPQAWIQNEATSTFALIVIYVWMWTGFCMVILSAALKGIPDEVIEAAKMDGAGRVTMFWRIMVPMIAPTLGVVLTTMIINILKIFDIIYATTGGNYGTNVVAMNFYQQYFLNNNLGLGSALAVLLTIVILPVMVINVRRMRAEERMR